MVNKRVRRPGQRTQKKLSLEKNTHRKTQNTKEQIYNY